MSRVAKTVNIQFPVKTITKIFNVILLSSRDVRSYQIEHSRWGGGGGYKPFIFRDFFHQKSQRNSIFKNKNVKMKMATMKVEFT
jgi:hypothetical protein